MGSQGQIGVLLFVGNDESVSQGRDRTLGPARATVVRNVLVNVPGEEVGAVDVAPVPVLGYFIVRDVVLGLWSQDVFDGFVGLFDQTGSMLGSPLQVGVSGVGCQESEELLNEWHILGHFFAWNGFELQFLSSFCFSIGPGVFRCSLLGYKDRPIQNILEYNANATHPNTLAALNLQVVDATTKSQETFFTPVGTPRVSYLPKHFPSLLINTIAHHRNVVFHTLVVGLVSEDAALIGNQLLGHTDATGNRSVFKDLSFHCLLLLFRTVTKDGSVLFDFVLEKVGRLSAFLVESPTSFANLGAGARHAIGLVFSSVDRARLVGDVVLSHPLVGFSCIASVATRIRTTRDKDLWSNVNVWPSSISGNLDSIREGRGHCVSPARSTILGQVLISQLRDKDQSMLTLTLTDGQRTLTRVR